MTRVCRRLPAPASTPPSRNKAASRPGCSVLCSCWLQDVKIRANTSHKEKLSSQVPPTPPQGLAQGSQGGSMLAASKHASMQVAGNTHLRAHCGTSSAHCTPGAACADQKVLCCTACHRCSFGVEHQGLGHFQVFPGQRCVRMASSSGGDMQWISWPGVCSCVVGGVLYLFSFVKSKQASQLEAAIPVDKLSGALLYVRAGCVASYRLTLCSSVYAALNCMRIMWLCWMGVTFPKAPQLAASPEQLRGMVLALQT